MNGSKGKFITLEGGEGCGKSTQAKLLTAYLQKQGIKTILTKEPGGTPEGMLLRQMLVTGDKDKFDAIAECLLYYADRRVHLQKLVWPALAQNQWVISDRFADSTEAYQYYGYDKRVDFTTLQSLYKMVAGNFKPDLTLILDMPPEVGMRRSLLKAEQMAVKELRFESRQIEFHNNLRRGFLEIAKREPERCVVLNADTTVEELHRQIVQVIEEKFNING
ncbi:MAG: dTMP kinase [Alphaproteobacteria bacterium]|nr:dTMP kinase [Alphaproteobacteria bacterium]